MFGNNVHITIETANEIRFTTTAYIDKISSRLFNNIILARNFHRSLQIILLRHVTYCVKLFHSTIQNLHHYVLYTW